MLFSETWAKIGVFFECGGVWGIKNITGVARDTLKLYFTLTIKILSVSLIKASNFLSHKSKFYHDWLFVGQKEARFLLPPNQLFVEAILRADK